MRHVRSSPISLLVTDKITLPLIDTSELFRSSRRESQIAPTDWECGRRSRLEKDLSTSLDCHSCFARGLKSWRNVRVREQRVLERKLLIDEVKR